MALSQTILLLFFMNCVIMTVTNILKEYAKFDGSLSERDHLAIRKTFSGMMKLLYPD
jgi:predicted ATP-dependent Lon-type protease